MTGNAKKRMLTTIVATAISVFCGISLSDLSLQQLAYVLLFGTTASVLGTLKERWKGE